MSNRFTVLNTFGAANTVLQMPEVISDGHISSTEERALIEGARLQNGTLDSAAIDHVEKLATQMRILAGKMRSLQAQEARPEVPLSAFPTQAEDLPQGTVLATLFAMRGYVPLSRLHTVSLRGGRTTADGNYEVLVAVHNFLKPPTNADSHFTVTVRPNGSTSRPRPVTVAKGSLTAQEAAAAAVGLSEDEAKAMISGHGYTSRVVMRDDEPLMVTADIRDDRISLAIIDGKVIRAEVR